VESLDKIKLIKANISLFFECSILIFIQHFSLSLNSMLVIGCFVYFNNVNYTFNKWNKFVKEKGQFNFPGKQASLWILMNSHQSFNLTVIIIIICKTVISLQCNLYQNWIILEWEGLFNAHLNQFKDTSETVVCVSSCTKDCQLKNNPFARIKTISPEHTENIISYFYFCFIANRLLHLFVNFTII